MKSRNYENLSVTFSERKKVNCQMKLSIQSSFRTLHHDKHTTNYTFYFSSIIHSAVQCLFFTYSQRYPVSERSQNTRDKIERPSKKKSK